MGQKGVDKKAVATWVISNVKERGYTPAYVSSATNISKHTLGAIYDSAMAPRPDQLKRLCRLFGEDYDKMSKKFGYYPPARSRTHILTPAVEEKKGTPPENVQEAEEKAPVQMPEEAEAPSAETDAVPAPADPKEDVKLLRSLAARETSQISPEMRKRFGKWFSWLLEKSGATNAEYSELIGVTTCMVSRYKKGTVPGLSILRNICSLHEIRWMVPACYFGYTDYKVPQYWLGEDYWKDNDWIAIKNVVGDNAGAPKASKKTASAAAPSKPGSANAIPAEAPYDPSDKTRIRKLEEELEKEKKAAANALSELAREKERSGKTQQENEELRRKNAELERAVKDAENASPAPSAFGSEPVISKLRDAICRALPGTEYVKVGCSGEDLIAWTVKLRGMEEPFTGTLLETGKAAIAVQEQVKKEAMQRLGF